MDIYLLVYGASVVLKPGQILFIASLFLIGFYSTVRFGRKFTNSEDYQRLAKKYNNSQSSSNPKPLKRLNRRSSAYGSRISTNIENGDATDATSLTQAHSVNVTPAENSSSKDQDNFKHKSSSFINSNVIC